MMVSMEMVNGIATTPKLLLSSASTMVGAVSTDSGTIDIDALMKLLVMVSDDSVMSIDWIWRLVFTALDVVSFELTNFLDEKKQYDTDRIHRMHTSNNCNFIFWANLISICITAKIKWVRKSLHRDYFLSPYFTRKFIHLLIKLKVNEVSQQLGLKLTIFPLYKCWS